MRILVLLPISAAALWAAGRVITHELHDQPAPTPLAPQAEEATVTPAADAATPLGHSLAMTQPESFAIESPLRSSASPLPANLLSPVVNPVKPAPIQPVVLPPAAQTVASPEAASIAVQLASASAAPAAPAQAATAPRPTATAPTAAQSQDAVTPAVSTNAPEAHSTLPQHSSQPAPTQRTAQPRPDRLTTTPAPPVDSVLPAGVLPASPMAGMPETAENADLQDAVLVEAIPLAVPATAPAETIAPEPPATAPTAAVPEVVAEVLSAPPPDMTNHVTAPPENETAVNGMTEVRSQLSIALPQPSAAATQPVTDDTPIVQTVRAVVLRAAPPAPLARAIDAPSYRLAAGDILSITVTHVPVTNLAATNLSEYSSEQQVMGDGTLRLPEIGRVSVAGMTLEQASDVLTARYRAELRNSLITVAMISRPPQ